MGAMTKPELFGLIDKQEKKFMSMTATEMNWEEECLFAKQLITKNDFTLKTASANPASLQAAILNVSAIGISLNPALAHAYLVPRDKSICLDISYKGLVKLATECGAIKWAKAVLVYEKDDFTWNGPCEMPSHSADPFAEDRGKLKGGYCVAKLPDGEILTDTMSAAEIDQVKRTSKAQNGPWRDWFEEMAKKTLIKRAYKSWPQTDNRERLDRAVQASHEAEGTAYTLEEKARFDKHLQEGNELEMFYMSKEVSEPAWIALYNSFKKGTIVENKEKVNALVKEGMEKFNSLILDLIACFDADDANAAVEILEENTVAQNQIIINNLQPDMQKKVADLLEEITNE